MIGWIIINVVTSVLVAMIVVFKITAFHDHFTLAERVGMGMIGAAVLMRCGPIIATKLLASPSPFDDWSTTLLNVGLAVYFIARLLRRLGVVKAPA